MHVEMKIIEQMQSEISQTNLDILEGSYQVED
jgi:hypothetical protein